MKLCTFSTKQKPDDWRIGVLVEDRIVDLARSAQAYEVPNAKKALAAGWFAGMLDLIRQGDPALALVRKLVERAMSGRRRASVVLSLGDVKLHAPIPRPGKILAVGRNYYEHLEEAKAIWKERGRELEKPDFPRGFAKFPSAVIGPEDCIIYPRQTTKMDYEVELAIVIGRPAWNIADTDSLDCIAGYTIVNDISARDWQWAESQHGMMLLGKNFDTFCPMGPVFVTRDEIPDPNHLGIELKVNGEVRQSSNTEYMIYHVPQLIAHWSMTRLEPGDVISTGTPGGVANARKPDPTPFYLKPGDLVEATVEGIGTLRNTVVAEQA